MSPVLRRLVLVMAALGLVVVSQAQARSFHVAPGGNDRASGLSPAKAWRTVNRVNHAALRPGDVVLFRAGRTFSDDQLAPTISGAPRARIRYKSYGKGRATLSRGIYLHRVSWLTFEGFRISGTEEGVGSGTGRGAQNIEILRNAITDVERGVNSSNTGDARWRIEKNVIARTGDSGVIVQGSGASITGNLIYDTGRDSSIPYDKHGIYSKSAGARIIGNLIERFQAQGVSTRFHSSTIRDNVIRTGSAGVGYWGDDPVAGSTSICGNTISGVRYGVLIGATGRADQTGEHFDIRRNSITTTGGPAIYAQSNDALVDQSDNHTGRSTSAQAPPRATPCTP
jgi:Right handed beta helix region